MMSCNIFRSYFRLLSSSTEVMLNKLSKKTLQVEKYFLGWPSPSKSGVDWDWCLSPLRWSSTTTVLVLLFLNLASFCFPVQPLPSSRLNGGCYGNFSRGIKVGLPGEVKRAVNPRFLSPRELRAEQGSSEQSSELRAEQKSASQWLPTAEEIGLTAGFEHCTS